MSFTLPKLPPALRLPATLIGAALLVGGCYWAVSRLDLDPGDLRLGPLLMNLIVVQTIILAIAATTLRISARVIGRALTFRTALNTVAYANFAEILPLPGGALVRGAALMQSGASLGHATSIVTLTAILTLALLISLSSAALILLGTPEAWVTLAVALAALIGTLAMIWRRAGARLALAVLGIRLVTAAAGATSIYLALSALSEPGNWIEAALLTVAASLGSAVAVIPAGLGISESIAAGLAALTSVPPAAAFLAVALHRALGLLASLGIIAVSRLWP